MAGNLDLFTEDPIRPESNKSGNPESKEYESKGNVSLASQDDNTLATTDGAWVADKLEVKEEIKEEVKEEIKEEAPKINTVEQEKEEIKEPSTELKEAKAEVNEAIKKMTALLGEESYEIPNDAKFKQKVDGVDQEVSMQELLNNYSGKQSWDKKYTELNKEKKEYEADLGNVNEYMNEFARKSKEDPVAALEYLAEAVGVDPFEYRKNLRGQLISKYGDYINMGEDQRNYQDQVEELDYLRQRQEADLNKRNELQTQWEQENSFKQVQELHKIDDERRQYLEKEMSEVYNIPANPESMVELHQTLQRLDKIDNVLDRINPEMKADDSKVVVLESLFRGNPQLSEDELFDMASKLWGSDINKAVANLTKKAPIAEHPKQQKYQPKTFSLNKVDFFD